MLLPQQLRTGNQVSAMHRSGRGRKDPAHISLTGHAQPDLLHARACYPWGLFARPAAATAPPSRVDGSDRTPEGLGCVGRFYDLAGRGAFGVAQPDVVTVLAVLEGLPEQSTMTEAASWANSVDAERVATGTCVLRETAHLRVVCRREHRAIVVHMTQALEMTLARAAHPC